MNCKIILFILSIFFILVGGCLLGCGAGQIVNAFCHKPGLTCAVDKCIVAITLLVISRILYLAYKDKERLEEMDKLKRINSKK